MYAWQRRSKKPLLPPRATDFTDVLKLSNDARKLLIDDRADDLVMEQEKALLLIGSKKEEE